MIAKAAKEIWNFFRAAGVLQAVLDGKAFRNLKNLPNENWAVLSCPIKGLDFDEKTLAIMDNNGDGHLRIEEVLAAVNWIDARIVDMSVLLKDSMVVSLSSFSKSSEGAELLATAKAVLKAIGREDSDEISLDDVLKRQAGFMASPFNGDGVLVSGAFSGDKEKKFFDEVIAAMGGAVDRSGAKGVDKATLDGFYAAVKAHLAWIEKGRTEEATLYPFGDKTEVAAKAYEAVRAKVDDFFHRVDLASFDKNAQAVMNTKEADYAAIASEEIANGLDKVALLPLSRIEAGAKLPLSGNLNPMWEGRIAAFADSAVKEFFGESKEELSKAEWQKIGAALAPFIAWKGNVGGACVAVLGEDRLNELLNDGALKDRIISLIDKDLEASKELNKLDDIEKFVRYHAYLNRFLSNYVNFSDYYNPEKSEIFRAGRLYIDGRVCNECVFVDNVGAHSALAGASKMFLAYCDISRPQTGEKRSICAAVTAGFASSLWVGRNGLFYDTKNKDWNAVIVKIVECQISLKEAFWAPWLKISDLISDQIKKLLSAKESAMMGAATTRVSGIGTPGAPAVEKRDGAALASSVAAVGIAIGIIGSAIGGLVSALKGVSPWQGLLGVVVIVIVVSGPAVLLAWFKLKARDFAPILNACGWAINKKMRLPMRLGRVFTHEAEIPEGSNISMHDPYVEKHTVRNTLIVIAVLLLSGLFYVWKYHNECLPKRFQRAKPCVESVATTDECGGEDASPEGEQTQVESETVTPESNQ